MATAVGALREKLGDEAIGGLQIFVDDAGRKWKEEMLTIAAERFSHRLTAEIGALRLDMAKEFAAVRVETAREFGAVRAEMAAMRTELHTEMADMRTELHTEMADMRTELRTEMADMRTELRTELADMGAGLRTEMAATRFSILKWAFLFWIGQVAAMTGIMALLLRTIVPR
jgi:hypothetical protein